MKNAAFEKRPFLEMAVLVVLMLATVLFFPQFKIIFVFLPIVYYLVEGKLRARTKESMGFSFANFAQVLRYCWVWILLVGIVFQLAYVLIFQNFFPEMFDHVLGRASLIQTFDAALIIQLIVLAFGEEITFRGLVQGRLQGVMKPAYAIPLTSVIFALMHLSPGDPGIVALDLATVFIDSIMFGIIFYKSKNLYASTIAHALANIVSAFLISML